MKKIIIPILTIFSSQYSNAQIAIGKPSITNQNVSLEFGNDPNNPSNQKGMMLPWIESTNNIVEPISGTLVFDRQDKKVKLFTNDENTKGWTELTLNNDGNFDSTMVRDQYSNPNSKSSIGQSTDTKGILVLEDDNKAMILPLVNSYKNIINPSAGMIAYDLENNILCIFNGTTWSFWKESEN